MTEIQLLTLSYGLTYLALGFAVNESPLAAIISFLISLAILVRKMLQEKEESRLLPVILNGIMQISLLIIGMHSLTEINTFLFISAAVMAVYNILFTYTLTLISQHDKNRVILYCGITFLAFAALVILADYLLRIYVTFIDCGVLAGFWILTLLMGTGILVTALFSLPYKARIIIEPAQKSKLS